MQTERMTSEQLIDMSLRTLSAAIEEVSVVAMREHDNRRYHQQILTAAIRLIKAVG